MEKWKKILRPIDRNRMFWFICIVASIVILLIEVIIQTWNETLLEEKLWITFLCNIMESLATAVLGTFILNIIYNLSEGHKISAISTVSYEDLLPNILNSLEKYKGRYRKDENITVEIHKYNEEKKDKFYKITLEYQYATLLSDSRKLEFKFYRIFNESIKKFTGGINSNNINCEFIWGADEREFEKELIKDSDYILSELVVESAQVKNIENYKKIENLDKNTDGNKLISYCVSLDDLNMSFDISKPIQLSYCVTLPLTMDDIIIVTHEFPTEKARIIMDYSEVKEEISIYGMPVTGTITPIGIEAEDNKLKYIVSGWILPKQGYIFAWWKKENEAI